MKVDSSINDIVRLPELEERIRRYSRIVYNLSQPTEYLKHEATCDHYKKMLIATVYEHNSLGGNKALGQKIDRLFESLDKVKELQNKRGI